MILDVAQPQRARIANQLPEHAAAPRQRADTASRLFVHADKEKALQLALFLVEDTERRVACAGELTCGLEQPLEHVLDVELGDKPSPGLQQALQLRFCEGGMVFDLPGSVARSGDR